MIGNIQSPFPAKPAAFQIFQKKMNAQEWQPLSRSTAPSTFLTTRPRRGSRISSWPGSSWFQLRRSRCKSSIPTGPSQASRFRRSELPRARSPHRLSHLETKLCKTSRNLRLTNQPRKRRKTKERRGRRSSLSSPKSLPRRWSRFRWVLEKCCLVSCMRQPSWATPCNLHLNRLNWP